MNINIEYEDIFDDDLEILEIIEQGFPRRVFQRRNYFEELDNYIIIIIIFYYIFYIIFFRQSVSLGQEGPELLNSRAIFSQVSPFSLAVTESVFLFSITCLYFATILINTHLSLLVKLVDLFRLFSDSIGKYLFAFI